MRAILGLLLVLGWAASGPRTLALAEEAADEVVEVEYRVGWLLARVPNTENLGLVGGNRILYFDTEAEVLDAIAKCVANEQDLKELNAKAQVQRNGILRIRQRRTVHRRIDALLALLEKVHGSAKQEHEHESRGAPVERVSYKTNEAHARATVVTLVNAVKAHYLDTNRLPERLRDLTKISPITGVEWLRDIPKDPWGAEFVYTPVPRQERNFVISSVGADGLAHSEDDIAVASMK